MKKLFDSPYIRKYAFDEIPIGEEIWLMDEKWMEQLDRALMRMTGIFDVGYVTKSIVRRIGVSTIELSWYLTDYRFHEVRVLLPEDQFVTCVDCPEYDIKPRVFVKGDWLTRMHLRNNSIFAMVDAIGVKDALMDGRLTRDALVALRDRIDDIASGFPSLSFISFADSLLIKSNWTAGQYDSDVGYTYNPEIVLHVLRDIENIYESVLQMPAYAVLTQGINEYYEDGLLHISESKNHISLNSLGLPFAQILAIDNAARSAIRKGTHDPKNLYMDSSFYHSLEFDFPRFDKNQRKKYSYRPPMGDGPAFYFAESSSDILGNLRTASSQR